MARVIVLGGAGFIGYHLARSMAADASYQITLVDDLSRGQMDQDLKQLLADNPQIEMLAVDLTQSDAFDRIGGPFDLVYLLAGIVGVRNVQSDPARVIHTNSTIILNTLGWLKQAGCGRLLFSSTSESYAAWVGQGTGPIPTPETVPVGVMDIQHPRSSYAITKMLGEAAVTHFAQTFGFESVIVRYHNVYGPRMGWDHVIPELMDRVSQKIDPLPVYGLEQTRAFCYVTDAVEASQALMACPIDRCELVHVGNDEEISIRNLLGKVLGVADFHPAIHSLPAPSQSVARRCPDISKLRRLTGFDPAVNLEHGLALTWEWYSQRPGPRDGTSEGCAKLYD